MEFLKQISGDNVKGILKDTIMVLCQNSVPHNFKLSVDAIIGITVDDTNVLLININDVVQTGEKEEDCTIVDNINYKNQTNSFAGVGSDQFADDELVKNVISNNRMDVKDGEKASDMPYFDYTSSDGVEATLGNGNEIVDEELDSEILPVNSEWKTDCTPLQHDSVYTSKCRSKTASGIKIEPYDPVSSQQHQNAVPPEIFHCNVCAKLFSNKSKYLSHKKLHSSSSSDGGNVFGVSCEENSVYMASQESCSTKTLLPQRPMKKSSPDLDNQESDIAWPRPKIRKRVRANKACDEEPQSFYTCNICGSKIRHLETFRRHKNQHLGLVFRCEICEKSFTRRDYLTKHQQMCSMRNFGMQENFQDYQASAEPGFDDQI